MPARSIPTHLLGQVCRFTDSTSAISRGPLRPTSLSKVRYCISSQIDGKILVSPMSRESHKQEHLLFVLSLSKLISSAGSHSAKMPTFQMASKRNSMGRSWSYRVSFLSLTHPLFNANILTDCNVHSSRSASPSIRETNSRSRQSSARLACHATLLLLVRDVSHTEERSDRKASQHRFLDFIS